MALFDRPLETITELDLRALIDGEVREDYHIEYKRSISLKDKQDKIDFLGGLSSFANSSGGDFIVGVSCKEGVPIELPGWEVDLDQEKQRIENLLRDAVEPRFGAHIKEVPLTGGSRVVIIRVPRSWAQPHMVKVDQVNRFYYRHSAGKAIMDITQLRSAFSMASEISTRIEEFRAQRLRVLKTGNVQMLSSPPGPAVVLHFVPFESMRAGGFVDLEVAMKHAGHLLPLGTGSNAFLYNLDGLLSTAQWDPGQREAYTQLFRNGIIESASRGFFKDMQGRKFIPSGLVVDAVLDRVRQGLTLYTEHLSIGPPAAIMLSLIGVEGYELATRNDAFQFRNARMDRDDLAIPAVVVEDFGRNVADLCRPMFDALWNAGGLARWFEYEQYAQGRA